MLLGTDRVPGRIGRETVERSPRAGRSGWRAWNPTPAWALPLAPRRNTPFGSIFSSTMARNGNGNGNGSARAAAIKLATQEKFLELYRECGLKIKSATGAGVCAQTIQNWCKDDPDFEAEVELARKTYVELLEAEIFRRGVTGSVKPVFYQGIQCGEVREYSDRMLELHIKRHNPEYRERHQVDMNVTGGVLVVPGVVEDSAQWEKRTSGNG